MVWLARSSQQVRSAGQVTLAVSADQVNWSQVIRSERHVDSSAWPAGSARFVTRPREHAAAALLTQADLFNECCWQILPLAVGHCRGRRRAQNPDQNLLIMEAWLTSLRSVSVFTVYAFNLYKLVYLYIFNFYILV